MLKRIQLRGISRTPSQRSVEDGGCDESLNVQIDGGETASVLSEKLITNRYNDNYNPNMEYKPLYIHKNGFENLISLNGTSLHWDSTVSTIEGGDIAGFTLANEETINEITSVGNMLMVATTERLEYILWKESTYKDLGDRIPEPKVWFECIIENTDKNNSGTVKLLSDVYKTLAENFESTTLGIKVLNKSSWDAYFANTVAGEKRGEYDAEYKGVCEDVWDLIKPQVTSLKKRGYFAFPVMARVALRLYDGEYIYQSVPILLGAGYDDMFEVKGYRNTISGSTNLNANLQAYVKHAYKAIIQTDMGAVSGHGYYEDWEDIVDSIDVFLSTDIFPALNKEITSVSANNDNSILTFGYSVSKEDTEEELLSKSIFYKVASFSLAAKNFDKKMNGTNLLADDNFASQDYLVTQPTLPDGYLTFHRKIAGDLFRYNGRLVLNDITYDVSSGHRYLNAASTSLASHSDTSVSYKFKFYINTGKGATVTVLGRNINNAGEIAAKQVSISTNPDVNARMRPYGWLAYPDARCYKVDVERHVNGSVDHVKTYDMQGHPGLNCAYCFIGLDEELAASGSDTWSSDDENRRYSDPNMIWSSDVDNPFAFPLEGVLTFSSKVIALASATLAIAEGQRERVMLYAFTQDGIWAIPLTSTGLMAGTDAVSRDVALSKKSVCPVEQSVVFVSAQGVMLLHDRSVTMLSDVMRGINYTLPDAVLDLIAGPQNNGLIPVETYGWGLSRFPQYIYDKDTTFDSFIADCEVTYDYANQRLLLLRSDRDYMYVYRFQTQSWHKMALTVAGDGLGALAVLPGSYPSCYLVHSIRQSSFLSWYYINDLSVSYKTVYDSVLQKYVEPGTIGGLVVTRAMDLDAPDTRKIIKDIRIRGKFQKTHVSYMLLGSMDGLSWGRLSSLRSGSYKFFRLVIKTNLDASERISWIDVEYEPRLANRLR